jgi:PIN domain nuclease of toxin-antitoxin system
VARAIRDADEVFVSAVSEWEVAMKVALGKLKVPGPLLDVVSASGSRHCRSTLPMRRPPARCRPSMPTRSIACSSPGPASSGFNLVSRDRGLAKYPVLFLPA